MKRRTHAITCAALFLGGLFVFFAAPQARAQIQLLPECAKTGDCRSLDDILQLFAKLAMFLLSITGSIVLLMFVWGGAEWIFSAGNADWVKRGRERMKGAVIGMVLVFSALAIIRTVQRGLGISQTIGAGTEEKAISLERILKCTAATQDQDCGKGVKCKTDGTCEVKTLTGQGACPRGTEVECITDDTKKHLSCFQGVCINRCENFYRGAGAECQASACEAGKTPYQGVVLCPTGQFCCSP